MAVGQRVINANVLLSTGDRGAFGIGIAHLVNPTVYPNFFLVALWLRALHLFFGHFKLGTCNAAADSIRRLLPLAYAGCCAPRAANGMDGELHEGLAELLSRYNVNDYAASVKVFAIKRS